MEQITHAEAEYLRKRGVSVSKTCRLKRNGRKRGKHYCPDDKYVKQMLDEYRQSINVVFTYGQIN